LSQPRSVTKSSVFDELMSLSLSGKMAIVVECGVMFKGRVNDCYIANLKLRVRVKISIYFRRMDLGQIVSIRSCKTTEIASYFEDFGVEDRTKMA